MLALGSSAAQLTTRLAVAGAVTSVTASCQQQQAKSEDLKGPLTRRLTPVGRASFLTETSTNRSIPGIFLRVEGCLKEERLIEILDEKLGACDRFQSALVRSGSSNDVRFRLIPGFKAGGHVFVDGVGSVPEPEAWVSSMMSRPLTVGLDQPQWELHVAYTGPEVGPETLLFFRLHHALADGIALGAMVLSLADEAEEIFGDFTAQALGSGRKGGRGRKSGTGGGKGRKRTSRLKRILGMVLHVLRALTFQALSLPTVLAKYLRMLSVLLSPRLASQGCFGRELGERKLCAWSGLDPSTGMRGLDLTTVKEAAQSFSALSSSRRVTLNDTALLCVTRAIGDFLTAQGLAGPERLRCLIPVNLRAGPLSLIDGTLQCMASGGLREKVQALQGNKIGVLAVSWPLRHASDSTAPHLDSISSAMNWWKRSPEPLISYAIAASAVLLPVSLQQTLAGVTLGSADCAVSNVMGPDQRVHIDGHTVTEINGMLPPPPGVPLGVVVSSYDGRLVFSVNADAQAVGDAKSILAAIESSVKGFCAEAAATTTASRKLEVRTEE